MATLNITLDQRVSAEIWPKDIGNEIRDKIRSVINDVVGITIAIFTTSLVVFMTTIQWAIYLLIILGVLWFAWRLLRKLYRRFKE
jgi:O-antigen ligase